MLPIIPRNCVLFNRIVPSADYNGQILSTLHAIVYVSLLENPHGVEDGK